MKCKLPQDEDRKMEMKIRDRVILAPMVRGSELAFRTMIRRHGIKHCYSPMLRAAEVVKAYGIWKEATVNGEDHDVDVFSLLTHEDGILLFADICGQKFTSASLQNRRGRASTRTRSSANSDCFTEKSLTVQLCGCSPETLYAATRVLMKLQASKYVHLQGIDLNLGCPQKCAQDGCFGAFLAENQPDLAIKCVEAMRRAIDDFKDLSLTSRSRSIDLTLPRLSCKIRLLDTDDDTISFAKMLEKAGCDILTIHCRHRIDKHHGKLNLKAGEKIVNGLSIPVIINGSEVKTLEDVTNILEETGAHAIMIARAFLRNPGMLTNANQDPAFLAAEYLDCCERYPPPSALYIQKHLRWIFRNYLQPARQEGDDTCNFDYNDWRLRLWTFLARPYLETIHQYRQVVALYVKLNGSEIPESLRDQPTPSFKSIKKSRDQAYDDDDDDDDDDAEGKIYNYQADALLVHFFQ